MGEIVQAKLLVIDGLNIVFDPLPRDSTRKLLLKRLYHRVSQLSLRHQLCILISNSVSTRLLDENGLITSFDAGVRAVLQPSLGTLDTGLNTKTLLLMKQAPNNIDARLFPPEGRNQYLQEVMQIKWKPSD